MSPDFEEWCEEYAEERMEEEYGELWMDTCPDDDEYDRYLEEAGNCYPGEEEDDEY